jgi:DNA repair exonuclease SbcCD ATPase subunit
MSEKHYFRRLDMSNIEALKAEVINLKNTREKAVQDGQPTGWVDDTIANLERQIAEQEGGALPEIKPAARQYDFIDAANFNEAFGVSFLNDAIQDLLDALRADLHNRYQTQIEEFEEKVRNQEEQLVQYRLQTEQLQEENKRINAERALYKRERDDFESRFNAAGEENRSLHAELEGKKLLLDEKQKHIDQLRQDLDNAPAPQANPINISGTNLSTDLLKQRLAEEKAKKPKVYDVRPLDHKQSRFAAVDEEGKEIEFGHLDMGRYNVQVGPFRPTTPEVDKENAEAGVTPEQFRVDAPPVPAVAPIEHRVANGESGVQEEDEFVTRAEVRAIVQEELAKLGVVKGSAA